MVWDKIVDAGRGKIDSAINSGKLGAKAQSALSFISDHLDIITHWGAIYAGQMLAHNMSMLTAAAAGKPNKLLSTIPNMSNTAWGAVADIANQQYEMLKDPNIEGIPIHSSEITCSREIDVSESLLIVQNIAASAQKDYKFDNAVPHLRHWRLDGYLTPLATEDQPYIFKPNLLVQDKFLDHCAKSRAPVWFKSDQMEFVQTLVASYNCTRKAEWMNGYHVQLELVEYNPYQVDETLVRLDDKGLDGTVKASLAQLSPVKVVL